MNYYNSNISLVLYGGDIPPDPICDAESSLCFEYSSGA